MAGSAALLFDPLAAANNASALRSPNQGRVWLLAILLLAGCATAPTTQSPSASPDPLAALLQTAKVAERNHDNETAAIALRQAVEMMAASDVIPEELEEIHRLCQKAMIEAGGNVESYQLWSDLCEKNPTAKEPQAMRERARKQILQQGRELTAQVETDLVAQKPQAALCTARAALELLQLANGSATEIQSAEKAVAKVEARLKVETRRP